MLSISPKEFIASKLRACVQQCQIRGLYVAATWAAEQLLGLEDEQTESDEGAATADFENLFSAEEKVGPGEVGAILLGSSLMASGQYQRCAHNLRSEGSRKIRSNLGAFLFAYAQYLAGEKLRMQMKEEKENKDRSSGSGAQKQSSGGSKKSENPSVNPLVESLYAHLFSLYRSGTMDAYLLYLFAVVTRDLHAQIGKPLVGAVLPDSERAKGHPDGPLPLFKQSLALNPWNWSCWLELASYCLQHKIKVPTWDEICTHSPTGALSAMEKQCGRAMFAFFMAHLYLERHRGDLALQAMEKLHKIFPSSVHLYTHVGVAYYSQRLYDQAEGCFETVRNRDPFRLQHIDTYSNILYVKEKAAELSFLAHSVVEIEKYSPEVCCVVGNYYSLKGQHERALMYFQRALRLDYSYLSAWTLMGHEYMELRNTAAAVQCYRSALSVSELDYRAWYGLGQTYEMLHLYQYANYYFKKAAFLRPSDARMWSAVGNCLLKLNLRTEAIATYERAVSSGDREGIATRDLARLYRDEGRAQRAAELYFKFLHCNIFEGSASNSSGEGEGGEPLPTALDQLAAELEESAARALTHNRTMLQPDLKYNVADHVADSEQAEALLFIAAFFRQQNQPAVAEFFCSRLLSFHGPEGDEARIMLKELRTKHQEPSALLSAESKARRSQLGRAHTPVFTPSSQYNDFGAPDSLMSTGGDYSMLRRSPRRGESATEAFDRLLNQSSSVPRRAQEDHDEFEEEEEFEGSDHAESSEFQFSRDDSQMSMSMSVGSPPDLRR